MRVGSAVAIFRLTGCLFACPNPRMRNEIIQDTIARRHVDFEPNRIALCERVE